MNYETLAQTETIQKTIDALKGHNFDAELVQTKQEVMAKIKELIPAGTTVNNGSSVTLEQIGYIDYLKSSQHTWNNPKTAILTETDPVKQRLLRKQATISDFYLGSVHAVTEDGELLIASNTGSQMPGIVYNSPNLIFVVGTQKIVPALADGLKRVEQYCYPKEDQQLMQKSNVHTLLSKILILKQESPRSGRKVRVIFVNEKLGF